MRDYCFGWCVVVGGCWSRVCGTLVFGVGYWVDARGSCGCTVPKYPKNTPIAPGQSDVIKVRFDSNGKPNLQQKTVTISANTSSGREMLRIKAMVTPDAEKQRQREQQARARQNSKKKKKCLKKNGVN